MKDFLIGSEPIMPGVQNVSGRDMFPVQLHMAQTLAQAGVGDPHFLEVVRSHLDSNGNFIIPCRTEDRNTGIFRTTSATIWVPLADLVSSTT